MTPAQLGFRMPAEWEPHDATWIAWPHHREDWPGKFAPIPWVYAEIVRILSAHENVAIVVGDRDTRRRAASILDQAGANLTRVQFLRADTDRVWLRDSGPTFVVRDGDVKEAETDGESIGPVALVDWKFNAWAKYDNYLKDKHLPRRIAKKLGLTCWAPRAEINTVPRRVVLEGGAIDVNGKGTLLTTEECLLSDVQARNPGLGREGIERVFADNLGVTNVIWLGRGINGDDTHGHVDDLARFVDAKTVVTVVEPDAADPNHEPLEDNLRRLKEARDQDGQPLRVVALPMPAPVIFEGERLPASYANFYIANGVVIVPTFNDPADRLALNILAELFPDREVVGVHCVDLVLGLGTLHCLSQQQPAAPSGGPPAS
ncbi:agmatine deiminase family protein [Paludisphaera borealis]|uniref:Agmatine deiminase n=1 Tax=Paludisphaera borealis TaxID=1387353 RepID=A0A1U7CJ54_9BACT|nr:agmatine deiminase family protein [Paludisphaera borealis]APW58938.1 Agmatine deiminase [Paludisphaera borealis]